MTASSLRTPSALARTDEDDDLDRFDALTAPKLFIKRHDGGLDIRYGYEIVQVSPADTARLKTLLNDHARRLS
jgi:hypothetical protein